MPLWADSIAGRDPAAWTSGDDGIPISARRGPLLERHTPTHPPSCVRHPPRYLQKAGRQASPAKPPTPGSIASSARENTHSSGVRTRGRAGRGTPGHETTQDHPGEQAAPSRALPCRCKPPPCRTKPVGILYTVIPRH